MKSDFYVIIIDDKNEVCQRIEKKITGGPSPGQSDPIKTVKAKTVHITLEEIENSNGSELLKWTFMQEVLDKLIEAVSEKPDLIIIDYIYVDRKISLILREKAKQQEVTEDLMADRVLSPVNLRNWIENKIEISSATKRSILNNIFNINCPIYLHTYTPQGIVPFVGNVTDRIRKVRQVFPNAIISSIDTRSEFYNSDEFDWPNPNSQKDDKYYPYQLAVFFDQIVQKEIIRKELKQNKYLRIKRTTLSVGVISAIGAAIGFAGSWIGNLVAATIKSQGYFHAFIISISLLFVLIIVGAACPFLFENWMQKIIPKNEIDYKNYK